MRLAASILLALTPLSALAQAPSRLAPVDPQSLSDESTVELNATLVEVPVVVSEGGGRYVTDLREADFTIFEEGVPQKISFFASIDEPFDVALVLDCSGSTREKLDKIKEAATLFIDQLRPEDRVALVAFDDEVRTLARLTSDRAELRRAIGELRPGAYSQVYEAVHTSAEDVLRRSERRKATILFSDGVDTASAVATFDDTLAEIEHEQIIVYPIRYDTRGDIEAMKGLTGEAQGTRPRSVVERQRREQELVDAYARADDYLGELAKRSGGALHRADTISDLAPALARIADELRHQYLLGYYPAKRDVDVMRAIDVRVSRPGLTVRARPGYRLQRRR